MYFNWRLTLIHQQKNRKTSLSQQSREDRMRLRTNKLSPTR
jgi:hypothetical protein